VKKVAAFGARLPMLVRGFYYERRHPSGKPLKKRKQSAATPTPMPVHSANVAALFDEFPGLLEPEVADSTLWLEEEICD
jgi:hypothetical protein